LRDPGRPPAEDSRFDRVSSGSAAEFPLLLLLLLLLKAQHQLLQRQLRSSRFCS
jgi:hypothetical protein